MIRQRNHHELNIRPHAGGQAQCVRGIVQHVDIVQRELTILLKDGPEVIDVPPDCPIVLHGERIKLRLIQPRDHVKIRFAYCDTLSEAISVEVQPDAGFTGFRL